ncbi:hypothetical protein [Microcoleus sp. bin38.metabat.b11b12b14.051]|uniref:hypothetical protein n=1 Tax=Microcoleus sp. bin38.metabat.b11b12b14.051 TaxID=2742709 RepID=UPI0025FB1EBB|nr:hypothetical protein [Microcoleus sp. bin38.metabat.b11b12b14.051]
MSYAQRSEKPGFSPNLRVIANNFRKKPGFWPPVRQGLTINAIDYLTNSRSHLHKQSIAITS